MAVPNGVKAKLALDHAIKLHVTKAIEGTCFVMGVLDNTHDKADCACETAASQSAMPRLAAPVKALLKRETIVVTFNI